MSEVLGGGEGTLRCVGEGAKSEAPDVSPPPPSESLAPQGFAADSNPPYGDDSGPTDVAIPELREIANPITGELIDVSDPTACAAAIAELRDLEDRAKYVRRILGETLVEESLRLGTKTLHLAGADVTLTEKKTIVWDVEKLAELRDAGLPEERWDELVTQVVEEKVNANVAKQLSGNPVYAEIVAAARTDHVGDRYVENVKRAKT